MLNLAIVLHNIRSLHNVGSVFRTADAAGAKKIYLCGITPAPVDRFGKIRPQLAKVSLGAEKSVAWEKASSTSRVIDKLKEEGYKVFAVEQSETSTPYYRSVSMTRHTGVVLVLGNEVTGLPKSILKKCDKILEIPMRGKKESLNVSVACGIALYRLLFP